MDDVSTRYSHADIRREVMRKVKFGQTIRIWDDIKTTKPERVEVLAFYPNYVLCMGKQGHTVCYRYHDLWSRLQRKKDIKIPEYIKG